MSKRIIEIKSGRSAPKTVSHAMGETRYNVFESTKEIDWPRHKWSYTIERMQENDYAALQQFFEHIGFHRLSRSIDSGSNSHAVILESNDHQIIRFVHKGLLRAGADKKGTDIITYDESTRLHEPLILQPLIKQDISNDYTLEVLPKVHTLTQALRDGSLRNFYGIPHSPEHSGRTWVREARKELSSNLEKCGLSLGTDGKDDNLAVIRDAKGKTILLILDPGAVVRNNKTPSKDAPAIMAYYEEAQQAHLKSLGLERGKLKGVLDKDELRKALQDFAGKREHTGPVKELYYKALEKMLAPLLGPDASYDFMEERRHPRSVKALYYQALKAGVSPGEFGAAARKAADEKSDEGFCQRIRRVLDNEHKITL